YLALAALLGGVSLWSRARSRRQAAGPVPPRLDSTVWGKLGRLFLLGLATLVFAVVTDPHSPRDFRGAYVASCLVALGAVAVVALEPLWWVFRKIRAPLRRPSPRLISPAEWEERFAQAGPEEQVELLALASLGSLGLGGRELLLLL